MSVSRLCVLGPVLTALLTPAVVADGRNPGSVLVYTVQRSGPTFFTVVAVSNSNPTPSSPFSFGGSTELHYEYANVTPNPADPFCPLNCVVFDRVEQLTPADTLSVVTACHNATTPAGQEGFLIVTARDPGKFEVPWSFNYLLGSELIINSSGGVYSINAVPFRAIPDPKQATDKNGNGIIDFNNIEYEGAPDVLFVDSFIAVGGSQLALLNLTGGSSAINTLQLTVWNDNEMALSSTRIFCTWFDQPLNAVSPLFEESFLKNSTPHDPDELKVRCDMPGTLESGWARIDSINVSTSGGGFIADDGAVLGSITTGPTSDVDGGRLLWESHQRQFNGNGACTTFTPPNEPPFCQLTSQVPGTIEVGEKLSVNFFVDDPDGNTVTLQYSGPPGAMFTPPPGVRPTPVVGNVMWTPGPNDIGMHTFRIGIEDGDGRTDKCEFTVKVEDEPNGGNCEELITITWNELIGGNKLPAGTKVVDQFFLDYGIQVSAVSDTNMAVIFDSDNPSPFPRDVDLGTPNGMIDGGPGLVLNGPGAGFGPGAGTNNDTPLGNLLILQNDLDMVVPNDDPDGGTIIITLAGGPTALHDFKIVDAEEDPFGVVRGFDSSVGGNMLFEVMIPGIGDNSVQQITADQYPIQDFATRRVEWELFGSGALGEFTICLPDFVPH